jgi:non-specific serine/threonine protein kinase
MAASAPESPVEFDAFRFEPANARLLRAGEPLHLEPKALQVLGVLIASAGQLVERDRLVDSVWRDVVVTPGTLTRLIAELRRALGDDSSAPRFIATVHTRGYRWIAELRRPHAPAGEGMPSKLPEPTAALIGRAGDLARLSELAARSRLVTVAGPGGVGKTQLALQFARAASREWTSVWADLSTAQDRAACWRAVASALDAREREDVPLDLAIAASVGERALLLVLDNCERVVGPVALLVRTILAHCPSARVLCTSQATLDLPEEMVHWLAPLALPSEAWSRAQDPIDALLAVDSVRLLVERARAVVPQFALDRGNAEAVVGVCQRLDGIPLALELAAARLATLTPRQLLAALEDRFAVLTRTSEVHDSRRRSLLGAIEWSVALLDDAERELLERFSVFAGSFELDAAAAVAGAPPAQRFAVSNRVQSLAQKSLLAVERGADEVRYRLLDSVNAYARAGLAERPYREDAHARHAQFFAELALAADAELLEADQIAWHDRLRAELPNLTAAFEWALARPEQRAFAAQLLIGLRFFFLQRASYVELLHWCEHADALCDGLPLREEARLRNAVALALVHITKLDEGQAAAARAADCAKRAGDAWEHAFALALLGWCAGLLGDAQRARRLSEQSARLAERLGDAWLLAHAHHGRAFAALQGGDLAAALEGFRAIDDAFARSGERTRQRFSAIYLALVHTLRGEPVQARAAAQRVADLNDAMPAERAYAGPTEVAAYLAAERGDADLAVKLLAAAARVREQAAAPLMRPWLPHHERAIGLARSALGPECFAVRWEEGRRLNPVEAHALAIACFDAAARA